jgi:mono/diheme cytochrome c family protein
MKTKWMPICFGIGFIGATVGGLASCGSFDFGEAPSDYVAGNAENPSWEADIEPVVQMKCMNCHGSDRSSFVPTNTPPYSSYKFDSKDGFKKYMASMEKRILNDANTPMPPNFATPLTEDEKKAVRAYIAVLKKEDEPKPGATPPPVVKLSEIQVIEAKSGIKARLSSMPPQTTPGKPLADESRTKIKNWLVNGTND